MYDELIARIRYHIRKAAFMGLKEYESTRLLTEAADAIEELQGELQALKDDTDMAIVEDGKTTRLCFVKKWIPVTERLPEDYERVLTCDEHENIHIFSHFRHFEYPFGIKPEDPRYFMPKWWMPLPEPPESGEA